MLTSFNAFIFPLNDEICNNLGKTKAPRKRIIFNLLDRGIS